MKIQMALVSILLLLPLSGVCKSRTGGVPMTSKELAQVSRAQARPAAWSPVEKASQALDPVRLLAALDAASAHRRNKRAGVRARILVLRTLALTALALSEGPAAALGVETCAKTIWPAHGGTRSAKQPAGSALDTAARRRHLTHELLRAATHLRLQGLPSLATPLPAGTDTRIDATPAATRAALLGMPPAAEVRALPEAARCKIAAQAGMLYVLSKTMAIHPRLGVQRIPRTKQVVLSRRVVVSLAATTAAHVGAWTATSPEGILVQKAVRYSCSLPRERHEQEMPSDFTVMCRSLGLVGEDGRRKAAPPARQGRNDNPTL